MAGVLGVPFPAIEHMVDGEALKPINVVGTIRHRMFDLNDVKALIENASARKAPVDSQLISLNSLASSELLHKFASKFHHVIELILQRKLDVYFDQKHEGFFDGDICKNQLIEVLEEKLHNLDKRLNIGELAKVLVTTPQCLNELATEGIIKVNTVYEKKDSTTKSIELGSLKAFLSRYTSINRLAFFSGMRVDKALNILKRQNIHSSHVFNFQQSSLYLIEKPVKDGDVKLFNKLKSLDELSNPKKEQTRSHPIKHLEETYAIL